MKSIKLFIIATFAFFANLPVFAQDSQNTYQAALTPEQTQFTFSAQGAPLALIALAESEMQQTKGASHFVLITIDGTTYKVPLPD